MLLADVIQPLDPPYEEIMVLAVNGARQLKDKGVPREHIRKAVLPFLVSCCARVGVSGPAIHAKMAELDRELVIRLSHLYPQQPPVIRPSANYYAYSTSTSTA